MERIINAELDYYLVVRVPSLDGRTYGVKNGPNEFKLLVYDAKEILDRKVDNM